MKTEIINKTKSTIPKFFIKKWASAVAKELKVKKSLTIAFVSSAESKELNSQYRGKKKPTDVLSFAPVEKSSLGELVLCLPVLKKQASEHDLSLQLEIGYMILHGILHLLGYDHEKSKAEAKKMFTLQDKIFEKSSAMFSGHSKRS